MSFFSQNAKRHKNKVKNIQKKYKTKEMFVYTFQNRNAIITPVNPNTLYSFCYTP